MSLPPYEVVSLSSEKEQTGDCGDLAEALHRPRPPIRTLRWPPPVLLQSQSTRSTETQAFTHPHAIMARSRLLSAFTSDTKQKK